MMNNATVKGIMKGTVSFVISSNDRLATVVITYSPIPMGGVIIPMIILTQRTTPK